MGQRAGQRGECVQCGGSRVYTSVFGLRVCNDCGFPVGEGGPLDTVVLGDCLEAMPMLPAASIDMALCDLPYGVTANAWDSEIDLQRFWLQMCRVLVPGAPVVMTATSPFDATLKVSKPSWFRYEWVWVKTVATGFLNANKAPLRAHEQVLVFCERQPPYYPQKARGGVPKSAYRRVESTNYGVQHTHRYESDGTRYPTTVLEFPHEERGQYHPTQKPVALFAYLIRTYTDQGATVLDPTCGSGTTAVACIQEGRHFIGIEQDGNYHSTACRRVAEAQARPRLFPTSELATAMAQQQAGLFSDEEVS